MQSNELSPKELRKYKRHINLDEIGEKGQMKLREARVLVLGAGSIGNPVLLYLSATGVGHIGICDNDLVNEEDLQRQIIYRESDIGKHKSIIAREHLMDKNSKVEVKIFNTCMGPGNIKSIIQDYDMVVATTDHQPTLYLLDTTCKELNKVFVYGTINGYKGQVTVFHYENGPSYRDLYPEGLNAQPKKTEGVYSILPGIAGSLAANEVVKIVLGIGNILSGKLLMFDVLNMEQQLLGF